MIEITTTLPSVSFLKDEYNVEETDVPVVYTTEKGFSVVRINTTETITLTRETLDTMIDILDSVTSLNEKLGG